jgi:hypothetical protein
MLREAVLPRDEKSRHVKTREKDSEQFATLENGMSQSLESSIALGCSRSCTKNVFTMNTMNAMIVTEMTTIIV